MDTVADKIGHVPSHAMTTTLTDDEYRRALAALQIISAGQDVALAVLSCPGERPLPALLAAYGQDTISRILIAAYGIDATMGLEETGRRVDADPVTRLAFVLIDTLHEQAAIACDDPAVTQLIASAILGAVAAFTGDDVLSFLRALRDGVLQPG